MVELAAIGFTLRMLPDLVWEPLPQQAKDNLAAYLTHARRFDYADNNWKFFRVLVDLGLEQCGIDFDRSLTEQLPRGARRLLHRRRLVPRRQRAADRPLHPLRHALLRAHLCAAGDRRRAARGGLPGAGAALRQGHPPLVRRRRRDPRVRAEPHLSLRLRRLLGRARLRRPRGAALGRDQGPVPAAPALVEQPADRPPRRRPVDRLRLSEPVHVRRLQLRRLALLGAQGLPAARPARGPSVLDGGGDPRPSSTTRRCRSGIRAW